MVQNETAISENMDNVLSDVSNSDDDEVNVPDGVDRKEVFSEVSEEEGDFELGIFGRRVDPFLSLFFVVSCFV